MTAGTHLPFMRISLAKGLLMQMQLVVVAGPDQGRSFPIAAEQAHDIGRGQDTLTKLQDPRVSRKHCVLETFDGKVSLKDGGSVGGTLVNHEKISQAELQPGDVIQIGDTTLRFDARASDATTMATAAAAGQSKPATADLSGLIGNTLHHYQIIRELARGASGAVFLAKHSDTGRETAVKVLWPELSKDEEQMHRFIRAMKTMLPIEHENIVRIFNAGKTGQFAWVAMEYVDGESLTQVIERIGAAGMLDWHNAYRVAVHIGRALECAAEHHIIHRNIMPANILLRRDKVAKLGDLMLAKALENSAAEQITRPGQLIGELAYMSPERTRGTAGIDCRSDIYGLGATVYALLTGHPPFVDSSLPGLISKIRNEEPVKPTKFQLSIPDMFQGAVLKMLAKEPGDRYQTPADLLKDLERVGKYQGVTI
jgi:serine/threonine protein kinase